MSLQIEMADYTTSIRPTIIKDRKIRLMLVFLLNISSLKRLSYIQILDSLKMSLHRKSLIQVPLEILEPCHVITLTSLLSSIKQYAETGQAWVAITLLTLQLALRP
jgi:hypothetical protein